MKFAIILLFFITSFISSYGQDSLTVTLNGNICDYDCDYTLVLSYKTQTLVRDTLLLNKNFYNKKFLAVFGCTHSVMAMYPNLQKNLTLTISNSCGFKTLYNFDKVENNMGLEVWLDGLNKVETRLTHRNKQ